MGARLPDDAVNREALPVGIKPWQRVADWVGEALAGLVNTLVRLLLWWR